MPPVVASTYGRFQDSFSLVAIVTSSDDKKGSETQLFSEPYLRTPSGFIFYCDIQYIIRGLFPCSIVHVTELVTEHVKNSLQSSLL